MNHLHVTITMDGDYIEKIEVNNIPALDNELERRRVLDLCYQKANELVQKPKSNPALYAKWNREKRELTKLYHIAVKAY